MNITLHLWEMLRTEHDEITNIMTNRAESFHRYLVDEGLYERPFGKQEFEAVSSPIISAALENIIERRTCYLIELLLLPGSIIKGLGGNLPSDGYGFEIHPDPDTVLNAYKRLFQRAGVNISWIVDEKNDLLKTNINGDHYELRNMDFGEYFIEHIYKIHDFLVDYAERKSLVLIDFAIGDVSSNFMLIPKKSAERISEFLISNDDPRISLIYPPWLHQINTDEPAVAHLSDATS